MKQAHQDLFDNAVYFLVEALRDVDDGEFEDAADSQRGYEWALSVLDYACWVHDGAPGAVYFDGVPIQVRP